MGFVSNQLMHTSKEKIKQLVTDQPHLLHGNTSYHFSSLRKAPSMASVVWEVKRALERGVLPEKIEGCSSEAFKLRDQVGDVVAIFKTSKFVGQEELAKEISAYALDHDGFAGVPPTVITHLDHPSLGGSRVGICQLHIGDAIHPHRVHALEKMFSAKSVRRIAALDIRILNGDRHTSNMLLADNDLIPIDHTLILPCSRGCVHTYFAWLKWSEAKSAFTEEEKSYILAIDAAKDRKMLLEEYKLQEKSATLHYIATRFLQLGVEKGLTAYDLGSLMNKITCMEQEKQIFKPSIFECALKEITADAREWDEFKTQVDEVMREVVGMRDEG